MRGWLAVMRMYHQRIVRVIAGTYRSRPLKAPPGDATRPTSDRLRETLFNILGPRIQGVRFADLYAGSGAVGIEALSRGASHVFFAEKAAKALTAIRANLKALGIHAGFTLESAGVAPLLKGLISKAEQVEIVFLDPPYEAEEQYARTLAMLGSTEFATSLAPDALVIAEHARRNTLAERYGQLRRTRTLLQGDAALSFFEVAADPQPLPVLVD